jgi:hypothetical protein
VITCDVVGSTKIPGIENKISRALYMMNRDEHRFLVTRFEVTRGDEFQAVIGSPEDSYALYQRLRDLMQLPLYAGLGLGKITYRGSSLPHSREMTGLAFVRSREALEEAKRGRFEFVANIGIKDVDVIINTLAAAAQFIKSHRTKRQNEIIATVTKNLDSDQRKTATKLGITQPTLSEILKYGGYDELLQISIAIKKLLLNAIERYGELEEKKNE